LKQLAGLLEEVESSCNSLKTLAEEAQEVFGSTSDAEKVEASAKAVEDAYAVSKEKLKACSDLIQQKGAEMRAGDVPALGQPAQPEGEEAKEKLSLPKILPKLTECAKTTESALLNMKASREKAVKKAHAQEKSKAVEKLFAKYDKDRDGMLSREEVKRYAKGEFNFDCKKEFLESTFTSRFNKAKGVKKDDFQMLKALIGIEREKVFDGKRKEQRLAREKRLAESREQLQEVQKQVEAAEAKAVKAETDAAALAAKAKTMPSEEMVPAADEIDDVVKEVREETAEAKKAIAEFFEEVDEDLKVLIAPEKTRLEIMSGRFEPKLVRVGALTQKVREDAKKKDFEEIFAFEKKAVKMLRHHQKVKELTCEELFAAVDTSKDDKIDQAEWVKFFETCEKEDPAAKQNGDGKDGEAKEAEAPEAESLTEAQLERLFAALEGDEEGFIPKSDFIMLVKLYMKVTQDSVLSSEIGIKDGETKRRLEVGEVLEILKGPVPEGSVEVQRVQARTMKDDMEGWVTLMGNSGSSFLQEGGSVFKVVTETILTESFELNPSSTEGQEKRKRDTTRKLKVGEVVDVREWARKDEQSGLQRMRCRCRSDGATGWVTTVGNQGKVFLQVV